MLVPDVNLLLYATIDAFPQHPRAEAWWRETLSGTHTVGIPAVSALGFMRIATNRRVLTTPMTVQAAAATVRGWLTQPHVHDLLPGARHIELTLELLEHAGAAGNLTTDAQIAALAVEHAGVIASNDTDFDRFPGVKRVNPLA